MQTDTALELISFNAQGESLVSLIINDYEQRQLCFDWEEYHPPCTPSTDWDDIELPF